MTIFIRFMNSFFTWNEISVTNCLSILQHYKPTATFIEMNID